MYPIWNNNIYYNKDTTVLYNGRICVASGLGVEPEILELPMYIMIDDNMCPKCKTMPLIGFDCMGKPKKASCLCGNLAK
jgi:hypothetical protein